MSGVSAITSTVGIGSLIMGKKLEIPKHQRDFKWDKDRIEQFFTDVVEAMERGETNYFVGLMVFLVDGKNLIVLDGQQRITTLELLFSSVRDWFLGCVENENKLVANKVSSDFIGTCEYGETETTPLLTLNSANNHDYRELSVKENVDVGNVRKVIKTLKSKDRRLPLLRAIIVVKDLIKEKASSFHDETSAATFFNNLIKYLRDNVTVVNLHVPSDGAAYSIFETLNDRGLSLAPLDLIKNSIFAKIDSDSNYNITHAHDRWTEMLTLLNNVDPTKFLRVFWVSRHEQVSKNKLFSAFKDIYKTPKLANDASVSMKQAAELYAGLSAPDDPIWTGHTKETRNLVAGLKIIGAMQLHPIMLAMLEKKFSFQDCEKILRILETVLVRYQLIGKGRANKLEQTGAKLALKIYNKEVSTPQQIREGLLTAYPSDEEFKQNFQKFTETTAIKASFLLKKIENEKRRHLNLDSIDMQKVTVEHILPKSPSDPWSGLLKSDEKMHSECLNRLGNLCLLKKDKLGNAGFTIKKTEYANSSIQITKDVANFEKYSRVLVNERQTEMADLATQIWRFPDGPK